MATSSLSVAGITILGSVGVLLDPPLDEAVMRTRNWSIRAKIISLLLVPLVTLVVMWVLATAVTIGPGLDLLHAHQNLSTVGGPLQAMIAEIQTERTLSVTFIDTDRVDAGPLAAQRLRTDEAVSRYQTAVVAASSATDLVRSRASNLSDQLAGLGALRSRVDRGAVAGGQAVIQFDGLIDSGYLVYDSLVRVGDDEISRQALALVSLGRARDLLAQEDALVTGALAGHGFTGTDLGQTVQVIGAQRYLFGATVPRLGNPEQAAYAQLAEGAPMKRLATLEDTIVGSGRTGSPVPVSSAAWRTAYDAAAAQLRDFDTNASERLTNLGTPSTLAIFGNILLTGVLGLVTVAITVYLSIRIARSLIRRLAGLRQAAQELAVDRLPRVVSRLRQGEQVDVEGEAPALPYGDDEIGQVGHAFNELQRTAVNSAVEEANVRRGLNEVFLNIARRSQTLLHRQLSILDRMERRADDPNELEDLFRVDHLATRMRRHAEDLVILAGSAPGRGWRNPVPVVDVVRGAVSEVEDYSRVSIRPMPDLAVAGRAVGDVIHLLAELLENATSFSPPHTRVNVGGEVVANGFAIEIEDRGLGMSAEAMDACNQRLAEPPDFDPANSAQLGLFVVARLAARHGVRVQLRSSPYGGVTAVALLPADLIVTTGRELVAGTGGPDDIISAGPGARAARYRELATAQRPAIAATVLPSRDAPSELPNRTAGAGPDDRTATVTELPPRPRVAPTSPAVPPLDLQPDIIEGSATSDGLPRRVRQSSLAPQLRNVPAPPDDGNPTEASATRSPEQLRAMMTSFQSGMNRGRLAAEASGTENGSGGTPEEAEQ
jgi:signal transduction histidine kinase